MINNSLNPISEIISSRQKAFDLNDVCASVCSFATVAIDGTPRVRIINLNGISGRFFELHCSEQSGKWQELKHCPNYELLLWWPCVARQYRIRGELEIMPQSLVEQSWLRAPYSFKLLDRFYEEYQPLGSKLQNQQLLLSSLDNLKIKYPSEQRVPPPQHLRGFYCKADWIEALYIDDFRIHERHCYTYIDDHWHHELLVP
ncbi:MAG: pyridoxamine 5'-phosphate oxidase family protein [Fischerella sp. CENA71]|nr:pyridoxamine 5'-phosphate oxidase family protein [Fischerella sp. CENA71]